MVDQLSKDQPREGPAAKGWSDYWQHDSTGGEVFVNAEGERHPALADYWQAVFADLAPRSEVVDLASGAGSIFAHLPNSHTFKLSAVDIAAEALAVLSERIPGVNTIVSGLNKVPLDDQSFDAVVSQFGIEYAGLNAFAEAARLVRPGGKLVALCHIENGYIDSNNQSQLSEAMVVRDSGFIPQALALSRVAYKGNPAALSNAEQAFLPAAQAVGQAIERRKQGIHSYLLFGFRELYEKRQQYDVEDLLNWLNQMAGELDKNIDRLARMRQAALSDADMDSVVNKLIAAGLSNVHYEAFETSANQLPVAWNLSALRR